MREEAVRRGIENYTTKDLQDICNDLRNKFGIGVLAKMVLEKINSEEKIVVDGIRNPGEIRELENGVKDFCLISIDAPLELRYERLIRRARPSDPKNWEDFLVMNKRDLGIGAENALNEGQKVAECMQMADYIFIDDYEIKDDAKRDFTYGKKGFLNLIKGKRRRPSFDENFMSDAFMWGHRSTCLRREVGAVIAKNNVFISQGYNGPSRGSEHCEELGGCLREKLKIPSGMRDEICRAIHGEINSILNAPTDEKRQGAKMYVTTYPCTSCARIISNSGIKEITYWSTYNSPEAEKIFQDAKISVKQYSGVSPISYHRFWGRKNRDFLEMIK